MSNHIVQPEWAGNSNVQFTWFSSNNNPHGKRIIMPWPDLCEWLAHQSPRSNTKDELPLIKLATFASDYRSNASVETIHGIEGDYDGERTPPDAAAATLMGAGIEALIVTTPSHMPERPRWRVLAPLSRAHQPNERHALADRLNGVLGGILAGETFTLSQPYYVGSIATGAPLQCWRCAGQPIDTIPGPPIVAPSQADGRRQPLGSADLAAPSLTWLNAALNEIDPNDLPRGEWIALMAAYKQAGWNHATPDELQTKFMKWCEGYATNNPTDNLKHWRSIRDSEVGWLSVLRRAPNTRAQLLLGDAAAEAARRQKQREDNGRIGEEHEYEIHTPIMSLNDMIEHLWFIETGSGGGAVANAITKQCISLAIARNAYAASMEVITYVDGRSGKEKQKKVPAIELWLKSDKRKRADTISWKPGDAILCDVPEKPGQSGFNTWNGLIKPKFADQMLTDRALREAWLPAWHHHLRYLMPVESERAHFEQWLANIVQRPGALPQTGWCFIATNTGIGRNWVASVLVRVLRGHVLANAILDGVLGGSFNGRMSQKLLIIVDEARAGMRGDNAWKYAEKLKTLVNAELHEINEKHGLKRAEWNAMSWLVFSNHWDALPIERNDRRWNVIENPSNRQSVEYYDWLYGALQHEEFIAAVWAHLSMLSLDGFSIGAGSLLNAARERMLNSLATDLELALQEFRDTWPAPVARFSDVEQFLQRKIGTNATRANIERNMGKVGIVYCGERMGKENTRFVITDSSVSEDAVRSDARHWLSCATDAAAKFHFHNFRAGDLFSTRH